MKLEWELYFVDDYWYNSENKYIEKYAWNIVLKINLRARHKRTNIIWFQVEVVLNIGQLIEVESRVEGTRSWERKEQGVHG